MSIFGAIGNWLGNAAHGVENFVSNDIVHPVQQAEQRYVQPAINNAAQQAGNYVHPYVQQVQNVLAHPPHIAPPPIHFSVPIAPIQHFVQPVVNNIANTHLAGLEQFAHHPVTVGNVANTLINKPFIQPALATGNAIGNELISHGVFGKNLAPYAQHVDPRQAIGNAGITALNALSAGQGGKLAEGASLGAKALAGAKLGGTYGGAYNVLQSLHDHQSLPQAALNTAVGAGAGALAGGAGNAIAHSIHPLAGAAIKEAKAGLPQLQNETGSINNNPLSKQILSHYTPSPHPTQAEAQALQHVVQNPQSVMKAYDQRVMQQFKSPIPNIVAGDEAKYVIAGFKPEHSAAYHEPASAIAKVKYDQLLADPKTQNKPVLIMSGGTGAGKTTALKTAGINPTDYAAIIDTNSNKLAGANRRIQQAIDSGRAVNVFHVHRDPIDAFHSVISRGNREGRLMPIPAHVDTHLGSNEVIHQLASQNADNPAVNFRAVDNSRGANQSMEVPLAQIPKLGYNKGELTNTLEGIAHDYHKQGTIPQEALQTYLAKGDSGSPTLGGSNSQGHGQRAELPQAQPVAENRFTQHVQHSSEVSPQVQGMVAGQHAVRNTKDLATQADQFVAQHGLDKATAEVHKNLAVPDGQVTDEHVAQAIKTAQANDALGTQSGHDHATSIYDSLSNHLVKTGQTTQAASLLLSRTPEGMKYKAIKTLGNAKVPLTDGLKSKIDEAIAKIKSTPEGSDQRAFATQDLGKLVNENLPHKKVDQATNLWITGLLTGPQTMTKVGLSHGVMNVLEKAKDLPAVALDKTLGRGISRIANGKGQVSTSLTTKGAGEGFVKGLKAAGTLMKSGHDTPGTSGFEFNPERNIGTGSHYGSGPLGKVLNFYTEKTRGVHAAIPKPFYTSAKENDLFKQAIAAAKNNQVDRASMNNFINDFVQNASKGSQNEANLAGQRATFQQPNALSVQASKARSVPGGKLLIPFAHIASAILSDVGDYSPIGAGKAVYQAVKEGGSQGWTPTVQKHFVEELGRSITGTSALAMGALLYQKGIMTLGYPSDPKEQSLWKASGKQENAILVDGKWRSMAALGPIGTVLSMGGYGVSALQQTTGKGNAALSALAGAVKNISGQSYLSGLTEAAQAVNDPQRSAKTFLKNEASSVVPVAVGTIARATDPLQRQTSNPIQSIESKIPGLREKLLPAQDAFGTTLQREGGVLTNLLDPSRPTTATDNAMINEISRLAAAGNSPMPVITKNIGKTKLNPDQVFARQGSVGPQIAQAYQQVMSSPGYQNLSDANKAKALTNAASDLNQVQDVKTLLQTGDTAGAQKAYNGLDKNQKAMFKGSASTKDYTALDAGGHQIKLKAPKVARARRAKGVRVARGGRARIATIKPPKMHIAKIRIAKAKPFKAPKMAIAKPKFVHIASAKRGRAPKAIA